MSDATGSGGVTVSGGQLLVDSVVVDYRYIG